VVAGTDIDPTSPRGVWPITYYGPYYNFYGNLVIIEHQAPAGLAQLFPELSQPVYSLYAHLSQIAVQVGEQVEAGQEIGKVGMSGIAEGPHLHFEVRLGAETYTSYKSSHNPELWLQPNPDENGQLLGALAVRFLDSYGGYIEVPSIVIEHLPDGPDQPKDPANPALKISLVTYEEKGLRGQPPFTESLGINDLPPGWYRINYPRNGMQKVLVQVLSGQLTLITIRLE
jgi:murein DD-endopeptidase MepM/ murein hydrolase activator NlpD